MIGKFRDSVDDEIVIQTVVKGLIWGKMQAWSNSYPNYRWAMCREKSMSWEISKEIRLLVIGNEMGLKVDEYTFLIEQWLERESVMRIEERRIEMSNRI